MRHNPWAIVAIPDDQCICADLCSSQEHRFHIEFVVKPSTPPDATWDPFTDEDGCVHIRSKEEYCGSMIQHMYGISRKCLLSAKGFHLCRPKNTPHNYTNDEADEGVRSRDFGYDDQAFFCKGE